MAIEKSKRTEMTLQDPAERAKNFDEVALGYTAVQAQKEAGRCLNCKAAPCKKGCPVGVDIPRFIEAVKAGDLLKAGAIIKADNSLPAVCGRVCPQEMQCEKLCVRTKMDEPVAIGALERAAGDYILEKGGPAIKKPAESGKKAAVIGSGPAGLTCAAELVSAGVEVTVFEAFHKAGGVLVYGIPEFRLPKSLVEKEIDALKEKGVRIELNTIAGKTITIEELINEYDAVFIGGGAGLPIFMNIKGESLNGVLSANEYLTRVNLMKAYEKDSVTPVQKGREVAVIGAGNVAMDAARTALRMGAEKVRIIYRRGRDEMPARRDEIHHAEEEGVELLLLSNPVEITGGNGWADGVKCVEMRLTEPGADGRRRPVPVEGSDFFVKADMVVIALGTSPNPLIKNSFPLLKTGPKGTIEVDEDMRTSVKKVYAGGDAVTGAATVILAMGAGRKASKTILKDLNLL